MKLIEKALWYIESHFAEDISLEDIAMVAGVSRWHLSRAFGEATGHSVMGYVRARRLSQAAKALAQGAPDILEVALEAGYGSHEAFTRAFCEQFGLPPGELRALCTTDQLKLVEPLTMNDMSLIKLDPPRLEAGQPLLLAGLSQRYTFANMAAIPAQWQRFSAHFGTFTKQVGREAYGAVSGAEGDAFDYLCGVAVADAGDLPQGMTCLRLPARTYAVFTHKGHISTIRNTIHTIWSKGLAEGGHTPVQAPSFERYDTRFDPHTGQGEVEIWIPVLV